MRYVRTHLIWMIAICLLSGCHTQTGGLAEGDGDLYLSQDQDYHEIPETFVAKLPFIINASETSWIKPYVKSLPESDEKKFLLYQIAVVKGQAGRAQYLRGLLGDADLPESWRPLSQDCCLQICSLRESFSLKGKPVDIYKDAGSVRTPSVLPSTRDDSFNDNSITSFQLLVPVWLSP